MTELIICRGLPASGKTTRADAWVAEDPGNRARVNRDALREMAHGGMWLGHDTERQIAATRDAAITALLRQGVSVVCDDTNLKQRTARDVARLGTLAGAKVTVWDMTDVPLDVCIERDASRERIVGEQVIRDMHARYLAGKTHPLPAPDETPTDEDGSRPYVPPPDAPRAVMVDIDGTVALHGSRSPFDETRVHEDRPNRPVIDCVRAMYDAGHAVVFCSGRSDACRDETERWLETHVGVSHDGLHMRATGDTRKDSIVKREIFDREIRDRYHVVAVFDDRRQVVDMWRGLGLTVMQVAPGDF